MIGTDLQVLQLRLCCNSLTQSKTFEVIYGVESTRRYLQPLTAFGAEMDARDQNNSGQGAALKGKSPRGIRAASSNAEQTQRLLGGGHVYSCFRNFQHYFRSS